MALVVNLGLSRLVISTCTRKGWCYQHLTNMDQTVGAFSRAAHFSNEEQTIVNKYEEF